MKDAIIILCGGGPAPGMNSVSMSVAKTFLSKGYRVIGLHGGYSGLFSKDARIEDLDFFKADRYFNRGGSYLEMSRFKPTNEDFEKHFNLDLFKDNNIKLLQPTEFQSSSRRRTILSQISIVLRQLTMTFLFLQMLLLSDIILQRTRVLISQEPFTRMPVLQATGWLFLQWAAPAVALLLVSVRQHIAL